MGKRAEHRETTERAILDASLRLLAEGGATGLTVRGLARELGMVPSGLYRYAANRDELLTLLIAHSHGDLAEQVRVAHDRVDATDLRGRWRAIAHAIREWSLEHPHEFALIFGTPVPGYHAPPERTEEPGTRVLLLLARLGADAEAAGVYPALGAHFDAAAAAGAAPALAFIAQAGVRLTAPTALAGICAWQLVMGSVLSEQFGYLGHDGLGFTSAFDGVVLAGEQLIFGSQTS
ncbi:MAG TPA: TetR/AcrR family transcriptional regulator [Propionicimonas sp.]|nr:TetR/AcrR family transcriptional regulator [Propionicimonas sp.]